MASFHIYDLDPDFWARVQAKAKAQGVTVKAVILKLLTAWLGVLALLLLSACAPSPTAPALTQTTPAQVPASLTLTGGSATSVGDVLLRTSMADASGKGVPGETVFLTTTAGTLNHASVITGPDGSAQVILTTTRSATVTAQARSFTATAKAIAYSLPLTVSASASPSNPSKYETVTFTASVTGGVAPFTYAWTFGDGGSETGQTASHRYSSSGSKPISMTVVDAEDHRGIASVTVSVQPDPDPPAPPPPTPAPALSASLTCTATTHGAPTPCNVTATYGGSTLPGAAVTNVNWDWADGTIVDNNSTGPVKTHTYATAGTYTVFAVVTATTVDGPKTATATKALIIP